MTNLQSFKTSCFTNIRLGFDLNFVCSISEIEGIKIMVKNKNEIIVSGTIELFKKLGSIMIDTDKFSEEIDMGKGTIEGMRANSIGPVYIKFCGAKNSPVRYRIDHVVARKLGVDYYPSEDECKQLLKKVLLTKGMNAFSLKETAKLYSFDAQKLRRDIKKFIQRKKELKEGKKVEEYPLVIPKYTRPGGKLKSPYQFRIDDIVEHICTLTYTKTSSK